MRVADSGGFSQMMIWLVVRDPLDHALSVYSQMVKRHGFSGSLDDWLEIYDFLMCYFVALKYFRVRRIGLCYVLITTASTQLTGKVPYGLACVAS